MAAVSAAMLRPPGGGLDPPYYSTQMMSYSPTEEKSKKSWGNRLKLGQNSSSQGTLRLPAGGSLYGTVSGPGGSALSKSMKYAETWLYGTVRSPTSSPVRPALYVQYADPPSPVIISTSLQSPVQNYAVVVCSCMEYLNGTKKGSAKKVSVCKKCKGSRLPLPSAGTVRGQVVGGTMRGPPPMVTSGGTVRAGTVRLQPTSRSRPTILSLSSPPAQPASDPYDLMRRTRLSSPMDSHVGSQFTASRSRAKSISPARNRSRRRSPSSESSKTRSKSVSRSKDLWFEEATYEGDFSNRRSILECDVNPYDLMNNENDRQGERRNDDVYDDFDNDETFNLKKLKDNLSKKGAKHNGPYCSVQAIGGQRIRVFGDGGKAKVNDGDFVYDDVEVSKVLNGDQMAGRSSSPKRPPRKSNKSETSEEESESDHRSKEDPQKTVAKQSNNSLPANRSPGGDQAAIKSILKKPRGEGPVRRVDRPPATPTDRQQLSGSHFYLPTPSQAHQHQQQQEPQSQDQQQSSAQRKKVQFLVENEIVSSQSSSTDDEQPDEAKSSLCEDGPREENAIGGVPQEVSEINVEDTNKMQPNDDVASNSDSSNDDNATSLPKAVVLRRSQSERLTIEGSSSNAPTFLDTMALRPKPLRAHSRQVFVSTQSLVDVVNVSERPNRPKDRPPPPPAVDPSGTISVTIVCSNSTSVVPITSEDKDNRPRRIRFGDSIPEPPPRSRSREPKPNGKKEPSYVKTRFIREKPEDSEKTTVQVTSGEESSDSDSRTVHRLSVTQNSDTDDNQRTSIMIGGDDCYSTVNINNDTPLYQSSVMVNNAANSSNTVTSSGNTVTISVYSESDDSDVGSKRSNQIYIHNSGDSSYDIEKSSPIDLDQTGKTTVVVDYEAIPSIKEDKEVKSEMTTRGTKCHENVSDVNPTSEEISVLLRDPVEAVKRNLVPHVCGKAINDPNKVPESTDNPIKNESELKNLTRSSFVSKLLEDPMLGHLAEGLETDLVAKLIENSLVRLKESRNGTEFQATEDDEAMSRLIDASLLKLQEERALTRADEKLDQLLKGDKDKCSQDGNTTGNNVCSPPYESMEYESGLIGTSSDLEPLSDCYNASVSELSTEEENSTTRSKFYQMLVDATLSEIEISHSLEDDHHYESIRLNQDPIYEEISDVPPPLPLSPPPSLGDGDERKSSARSIFEGASKYDILSYLVDAKERGIVPEDSYSFNCSNEMASPDDDLECGKVQIDHQRQSSDLSSRVSNLSNGSDSSEDNSLIMTGLEGGEKTPVTKKSSAEIERNDSGVGSETSKCSRSRWQGHNIPPNSVLDNVTPIHLCEDCDGPVETQVTESGVMFAPLVCRKCGKKRAERKEIITEIVETEEKYGRDLQIILEEFYQPMLVAGLLTQEQLSAIFLNVEELLENNQSLAERLRDALEISIEQGDEDLLTVNIGKLMLESTPMLHAFSSYCVRQGTASMLLSSLEKEKELLRIFLKVSQMENAVLRRMNLNSFLMVPVQRVTKYPLLLSRLYKVTPHHLEGREALKQAQQKIEQHLSHMNSEAKDVTTLKLWRRISSGNNGRRSSSEMDMINIKLRKLAVDVLEWNHDEARFAIEGKLLFTQPNDNNWRKGRTIKLTPINALLVTNGKPTAAYKPCDARGPCFPRNTGVREASLVLARDKGGRTALLREPLYLDRCVVAAENDWDDYFELQEIVSKDTYIFKAEDSSRTKQWCQQLQYHCQGMGAWRKRRNALANIMINGMMMRN